MPQPPTPTGSPSNADQYADWLTGTAGLAPSTARTYTGHLRNYSRWWQTARADRQLEAAEPVDVEAYLAHLARRGLHASTRRTALHALRAYYSWLTRSAGNSDSAAGGSGHQPADAQPVNPAATVRRPRVPKPRTVIYTPQQADAILAAAAAAVRLAGTGIEGQAAQTHQAGEGWPRVVADQDLVRAELDHVVLATLRWTGLRTSELCALGSADLDLAGALLRVRGKGSKHRAVPVPPPLMAILRRYLAGARSRLLDDSPAGAPGLLFHNPASPTLRLTPRALLEICRRHGDTAQVAGPHRPLRWRHTYATHSLALGVNLHTLARLLGHASVATTERYLHLDTAALQDAVTRAYTPTRAR